MAAPSATTAPSAVALPPRVATRVFFLVGQTVTHSMQEMHLGESTACAWEMSMFMGQVRSHFEQEMQLDSTRLMRKRGTRPRMALTAPSGQRYLQKALSYNIDRSRMAMSTTKPTANSAQTAESPAARCP